MPDDRQTRSGCGRILLIFFGIVFFAVMGVLIWLVYTSRSLEEEIRAKGEPTTLAELNTWYTQVPEEENAALVVLKAAGEIEKPPSDVSLPQLMERSYLEGQVAWDGNGETLPADTMSAIAAYLAANRECLASIAGIDSLNNSRYPIDTRMVLGGPLSHLDQIRGAARLLVLDATYKAETSDAVGAGVTLERAFRLSETLRNEPFLISQLVRVACHTLACGGVEHVLNRVALPDEQLARLQSLIRAADDPDTLYRAFVGERCLSMDPSSPIRRTPIISQFLATPTAQVVTEVIAAGRLSGAKRRDEFARIQQAVDGSFNPYAGVLVPAFGRTHETHDRDLATLRVAATVIAIERYRIAENKIPDSLSALAPRYLDAVPIDPFDEQPLRFLQGDSGYLVYSIGPNLRDDQGAEPDKDARITGDIVIKVTR
ncbi:MAG: hypothetical protein IT366_22085 [Candidatus Hydrogenedentes bacterium]|nr:hypothetical protein [Candidatus Hydrogenedentota bacterium]